MAEPLRAVVIGGSLGGLFAANMLRTIGWDVDVFERSPHDLDSRGGGIVLQPDVVELFRRVGAPLEGALGVPSRDRITYHADGSIRSRQYAPQTQTSWSLIYTAMRDRFGRARYHQGRTFTALREDGQRATAIFSDGDEASADLLIGADGGRSTVRGQVDPGNAPRYAGYIAWRGLVEERQVPIEAQELVGHFAFANARGSHMLGYLVPGDGNAVAEGERLYNWVWYRVVGERTELPDIMTDRTGRARGYAVPPGMLTDRWREHVYREADALLPPQFSAMVRATQEPFAQGILDLTSDHMVYGRTLLIGDAAFIPRPHTAASTSKAAANALSLGEAMQGVTDPEQFDTALPRWERDQLALGRYLYQQGTQSGDFLLFHSADGTRRK